MRSRFFEPIAATLLVPLVATLFLCCSSALVSQTKAAASPPIPQNSLPGFDPTNPETQPSLTVNRDPVPSPDEAAEATSKSSSTTAEQGTAIQKNKSGIYTLRENVNEVILNCTVVDENGELVKGLAQRDFRVWEDGVPQTIQSFQYQDLPVSMGILVDNSGSMRDKRSAVDKAALDLVRASNPHDEAFVVNFSDKAYLDQGFTSKLVALEKGLSRFDAGNMTALYDAVAASADELSKYGTHPKEVLLIITDGADNASQLTLAEAVRRVQYLGGPVVYSIGLLYDDSPQEAQKAKSDLEELSADTGGIAYFPSSVDQVNEVAEQVASDIRHQYTIGYRSTKPASLGGFRTVRVEATAPHYKKLIVRTRKGYYPGQRPGQAPARPQQVAQTAK